MKARRATRLPASAAATVALIVGVLLAIPRPIVASGCVGDCNGNNVVQASELTAIVARVLLCNAQPVGPCGSMPVPDCAAADNNGNGVINAGEVTNADFNALVGCSAQQTPTPPQDTVTAPPATATPFPDTPTATSTPQAPTPSATLTRTFASTPTPSATPTATAVSQSTATKTSTSTPAATPTARPAVCGNGVLENGETCAKCAADCKVKSCTPTSTVATFFVTFEPPVGTSASSVTALVGYSSAVVSIPGKGTGSCNAGSNNGKACNGGADCPGGQCVQPKSRVKNPPPASFIGANDLDYALSVVVTRSSQIAPGRIFSVDFDTCQGAPAPTLLNFGCTVTGCASSFGPIDDCTCTVVTP